MENRDLITRGWSDYELIDSGGNRKLERFGKIILIRPETQALWHPSRPQEWKRADAEFRFGEGAKGEKGGSWRTRAGMPESWEMGWKDGVRAIVRPTPFKHTGVFPEQAANWEWIAARVDALAKRGAAGAKPRVLNLFGYTGIASIVAAKHGADVTQCDASKQSNTWAHENARLSGVDTVRWITDDALAFVLREVRRGAQYDGIILDPPAFGRGAKGEVFRIEEHLPKLLEACATLLSKKPGAFFLLNGYAAGYAPVSFVQAIPKTIFNNEKGGEGEFGELQLEGSDGGAKIASGIYVRGMRI